MHKIKLTTMACLAGVALAGSAHANLVDFNAFPTTNTCLASASDGGLGFADQSTLCMGVWTGNPNSNGTPGLILGFGGYTSITKTGGGAFDLNSLDMAISWYETATASSVDVIAYFNGGGSSTQTLNLSTGLQTYGLNLLDVLRVDVTALSTGGGYWVMDNVDFNPNASVPEPASLALLGIGLLGMGALRNRKG